MTLTYCEKFGLDDERQAERIALLELGADAESLLKVLHDEVIGPYALVIIDRFYDRVMKNPEAKKIMSRGFSQDALARTQLEYLLGLGLGFNRPEYFERRLQIGMAHIWAGVSLGLYLGAYSVLQQEIIGQIPRHISNRDGLIGAVLKITMLDMSLSVEAYHWAQVNSLEESLAVTRDHTEVLHTRLSRDGLTQLQTRASVLEGLQEKLERVKKTGAPLCIVMVDIDFFKKVNDNFGHLVGDKVLHDVASRMGGALRASEDVGRYGGEEFLIVLPDAVMGAAHIVAERVRSHVAATPIQASGSLVPVTVSLGLAQALPDEPMDSLIARADSALYEAKRKGRNRVELAPEAG